MADLAAQIRARLDGWAPPAGEVPGPPFVEIVDPGKLTPEQIEAWQQEWDRLIEEARHQPMQLLVHESKFYPGFVQMSAALLAALDDHGPDFYGNCRRCHKLPDDANRFSPFHAGECPTVLAIAKELGIEVDRG